MSKNVLLVTTDAINAQVLVFALYAIMDLFSMTPHATNAHNIAIPAIYLEHALNAKMELTLRELFAPLIFLVKSPV